MEIQEFVHQMKINGIFLIERYMDSIYLFL